MRPIIPPSSAVSNIFCKNKAANSRGVERLRLVFGRGRTAPLHTTVDAGAPPAGAVPGLVRRRARVGGCSEAWRELYVRLDTKSAPWSDDNGPRLVFGWRWSEGVLPHHPERTTGRSVPVGSGHHCEAAPKGTYAALISRPRAVCRARTAPTTAAKSVRKLIEASLTQVSREGENTGRIVSLTFLTPRQPYAQYNYFCHY